MPAQDWKERGNAILKKGKGKYLSVAMMRKVEKGVGARVPVAEVRAYVARLIEDNGLKETTGRAAQQQWQQPGDGKTPRIPELATQASLDMIKIGAKAATASGRG